MSERTQEIIKALREPELFCAGCNHHGEPRGCNLNGIGCKAMDIAQDAADLIESLQRETDAEPLTEEDYKKHVDKHVWAKLPSGKILPCLLARDIVTRGYGLIDAKYGFWPLNGNITIEVYATEPKGEATP